MSAGRADAEPPAKLHNLQGFPSLANMAEYKDWQPFKQLKNGSAPRCQGRTAKKEQCSYQASMDTGFCTNSKHAGEPPILPEDRWPVEWPRIHPDRLPAGLKPTSSCDTFRTPQQQPKASGISKLNNTLDKMLLDDDASSRPRSCGSSLQSQQSQLRDVERITTRHPNGEVNTRTKWNFS